MKKILIYLLGMLMVSMFYFPINFSFLPTLNTKNLAGAVGFIIIAIKTIKSKNISIPLRILILCALATAISLIAYFSVVYNGTNDLAYATYIVSMLIWTGAAVYACSVIKLIHGKISIELTSNYVIAVCVYQCIMAMLIEYIPSVQTFVDTWIIQGQEFLHDTERLYGIGASLDTAGGRFSVALVMICGLLRNDEDEGWQNRQWLYLFAFAIIAIIGNMVARTTTTGLILGLLYLLLTSDFWKLSISRKQRSGLYKFASILLVCIPIVVLLYNTNDSFRELTRFGFEGFFSLVEKGEWDVRSNTALESMVVFPETTKTWIIGDGYFSSPNSDLNYLGDLSIEGFYMGTDIGYLRFIFYFGILGLLAFIFYIAYSCSICCKLVPKYRLMFMFILLINYVVWLKVATDLFLVFALFICCSYLQSYQKYEDNIDEINEPMSAKCL